jgi:transposase
MPVSPPGPGGGPLDSSSSGSPCPDVFDPAGTTKECASCGVETDKPLWVREHSCPACGFEADRDANAVVRLRLTGSKREAFATAWDIRSRGLSKLYCRT